MPHIPDAHAAHDRLLLAAYAAGDLEDAAASDAEALVTACPACAELVADLHAIARATAALPAPPRRRDFRLTAADAARLRGPWWRRAVTSFAAPRLAFTRPLAAALTTLGLAGLLLNSVPASLTGGSPTTLSTGGAPVTDQANPAASTVGGVGAGGAPAAGSVPGTRSALVPSPAATAPAANVETAPSAAPGPTTPPALTATAGPSGPEIAASPQVAASPRIEIAPSAPANESPFVAGAAPAPASDGAGFQGSTKSSESSAAQPPLTASRNIAPAEAQLAVPPLVVLSALLLLAGLGLFALRLAGRRMTGG